MNAEIESSHCPVCASPAAPPFFVQRDVPVQCGYLAPTREEALKAPLGDITLRYCASCGHVWNSSLEPEKIGFDPNYDLSQYFSPTYRAYVAGAIERLKTRYDLAGKTALDIACGKGDFMRMLIAAGFDRAIGFDPTFIEGNLTDADRERITVHKKFYDQSERGLRPDLVTCRSALQYMTEPRQFLRSVREVLDGQHETIVCFEVLNGAEPFRERVVWYVMYEAGCFYSEASLARLFRECGFQVLDVLPAFGGGHLEIEARPARVPEKSPQESPDRIAEIGRDVEGFTAEYASQVADWSERFAGLERDGRKVVLWGAGMRAVSLLANVPQAAASVEHVVDVNPLRQGRFLPKTGQEVIGPDRLAAIEPDLVIATNPHYAPEILGQLRSLGLDCEFGILR